MQFPKIRGFCRKQPLEKSHGCGHNDWHIPALRKLSLLFCQLPLAMIFQQNVIPRIFRYSIAFCSVSVINGSTMMIRC